MAAHNRGVQFREEKEPKSGFKVINPDPANKPSTFGSGS
jgi:hypothetical protein